MVGGGVFILLQNNIHCGALLFGSSICQIKTSRKKNGMNVNLSRTACSTGHRYCILGYLRYQCVCMLLQRYRKWKICINSTLNKLHHCHCYLQRIEENTIICLQKKRFFKITLQQYPLCQPISYCFLSLATSRPPSYSSFCKCTRPLEFSSLVSSMSQLFFKLSSSQIRGENNYYLVKIDI